MSEIWKFDFCFKKSWLGILEIGFNLKEKNIFIVIFIGFWGNVSILVGKQNGKGIYVPFLISVRFHREIYLASICIHPISYLLLA